MRGSYLLWKLRQKKLVLSNKQDSDQHAEIRNGKKMAQQEKTTEKKKKAKGWVNI